MYIYEGEGDVQTLPERYCGPEVDVAEPTDPAVLLHHGHPEIEQDHPVPNNRDYGTAPCTGTASEQGKAVERATDSRRDGERRRDGGTAQGRGGARWHQQKAAMYDSYLAGRSGNLKLGTLEGPASQCIALPSPPRTRPNKRAPPWPTLARRTR